MKVNVINRSGHPLPAYETLASAGMDLRAALEAPVSIHPGQRLLIPTGLFIELPVGFEAQIRPRSGLAAKHGITVLNTPGTIDADYRGEVMALLTNTNTYPVTIMAGDRIAQLLIMPVVQPKIVRVDSLDNTTRGTGGFGSTGE